MSKQIDKQILFEQLNQDEPADRVVSLSATELRYLAALVYDDFQLHGEEDCLANTGRSLEAGQ